MRRRVIGIKSLEFLENYIFDKKKSLYMVFKKLSSNLKNNKLIQMFNVYIQYTYAYTNLVLEMYKIKYFLGHPVIIAASSCRRDSVVGACTQLVCMARPPQSL